MKAHAITMVGSLVAVMFGCHVSVDDYCDDDDDWHDDDEQPCETHVHADTTSTSGGSMTTVGAGGGSASVTSSGATTGSAGSGGSTSAGSGGTSGGSANGGSGGSASDGSASDGTGGSVGTTSDSGATGGAGESSVSATATSGTGCSDCVPPQTDSCLWGTTTMDACCTADVLVDVAAQGCAGVELTLSDFALEEACAGGHYQVSYQCCREVEDACVERSATLEVCVSEEILMSLAQQWCGETNQVVADMVAGDDCGDGTYQSVAATCCSG